MSTVFLQERAYPPPVEESPVDQDTTKATVIATRLSSCVLPGCGAIVDSGCYHPVLGSLFV